MTLELKQRLSQLDATLRELQQQSAAVDAVIAERRTRASILGKSVAEARHRLELNPDVQSFMIALQQRVHQRGVGLYERLLTALVQDVLPENPHPVSLDLSTEKGLPALTIQLGAGDTAQNIFEDTGGSLTNVISSGLRFIALARSPLRKFLILDEPDCWIEPFRIPRFADILADMSDEVGVQAILISHHQDSSFSALPDRMKLEKDSNGIIRVKHMRKPVWADPSVPGIRSIRLERFMSHLDTLIELGPGINVLSGANHIGKSAVVNSMRVLAYHTGADRQIMHGHDNFVITITFDNGKIITCKRNRKGSPKTVYSYFEPGMLAPRVEPAGKTEPPSFVMDQLKILKLNDLDIQLSHQKMPVFLLNEPHTKQATLLSAGLEADHVRKMLEQYKKWNDLDRATVRNDEKELMTLTASLEKWDSEFSGKGVSNRGLLLNNTLSELRLKLERSSVLSEHIQKIKKHELLMSFNIRDLAPVAPIIRQSQNLYKLHTQWTRAEAVSKVEIPALSVPTPVIRPLSAMMTFGKQWAKVENKAKKLNSLTFSFSNIKAPVLADLNNLQRLYNSWTLADSTYAIAQKKLNDSIVLKKQADDSLFELGNGFCIVCGQVWPHNH